MKIDNKALEICRECKAFCCHLGATDFSEVEKKRVLDAGFKDYFIKLDDDHYEMKCKNGICPYLNKDYSCMIHDVRPLTCKSFPVYPDSADDETKFLLIKCPLASALSKKDIEVMKKQVNGARKIIFTAFTYSKLPKSDFELIKKRFNGFKKEKLR